MSNEVKPDLPVLFLKVAAQIAVLSPGGRANLRRLDLDRGCADFWRILSTCDIEGDYRIWAHYAKIVAILTPNADAPEARRIHNDCSRLGRVLFEADLSEARFNRLCTAPLAQRREQLERIARGLDIPQGLDLVALGFLLTSEHPEGIRTLSRDYFAAQIQTELKEKA